MIPKSLEVLVLTILFAENMVKEQYWILALFNFLLLSASFDFMKEENNFILQRDVESFLINRLINVPAVYLLRIQEQLQCLKYVMLLL